MIRMPLELDAFLEKDMFNMGPSVRGFIQGALHVLEWFKAIA